MSPLNKKNHFQLRKMRHSCEHILTQAMLKLYPKIKMAMGPAIEDGFYFDFDPGRTKISEADFTKIEKEMKAIVQADLTFKKKTFPIHQARKMFKNNPYKQEWLDEIEKKGESAVIYYTGNEFFDLCNGPHLKSTGQIGPFKLLSIAGAYWHGNEKNKMLTRIYGTCFPNQKELDLYLWQKEEARKRDHRILGKKLDFFSFHPEAPGDVFWHPKGLSLMLCLYDYWRRIHRQKGYVEIRTPEILTKKVWDQSGHTKFYQEKIYKCQSPDSKDWNYCIKPMNCNGGILIYKTRLWSYKDFPLKMGEIGVVHRYEASGELHGVIRPREFTQDDAHIFCTPNQIKEELKKVIDLCFEFYKTFGLAIDHLELSTRPEKSIGSDEVWQNAEEIMRQVLKEKKVPYQINQGDGAFYGPKFDFHLKDSMKRTWQCATIQLDFAQPENFHLEYIDEKSQRKRPVMIHRVVYGSIERFLGILIEHYGAVFPLWLAPVQVMLIQISDTQKTYVQKIYNLLTAENIRTAIDERQETMQKKIKSAEEEKIPYMLILGAREMQKNNLSVRKRGGKNLGQMNYKRFQELLKSELEEKK